MEICPTCGPETKLLVVNLQTSVKECWPCVAREDQMMLRSLEIKTERRVEVVCVRAANNLEALATVRAERDSVIQMIKQRNNYN